MNILRGNFVFNQNEDVVISTKIFRDFEYIGLYFSASWSPPCITTFLPLLKSMFKKINKRENKFQIIYVPTDTEVERSVEYFIQNHGPWYENIRSSTLI